MKRFLFIGLLLVTAIVAVPALWSVGANLVDAFDSKDALVADAASLKATRMPPHLEAAIEKDGNVVWCGTFQLAWNEVCTLIGEDLHFAGQEPEMVALLNKKSFAKNSLDEAGYVAIADFVRNGVHDRIRREVTKKFAGRAKPNCLPSPADTPRPQDIVSYSFLFKNLKFPVVFERIEQPLSFSGSNVSCFGIDHQYKPKQEAMYGQVQLLDYQDRGDFVVELRTKSKDDRLILAKMKPKKTLSETIAAVEQRVAAASSGDVLVVPKFNFDLSQRFPELRGLQPKVANPAVAKDLQIVSAIQDVRFQMDEKGVKLQSEAHISFGCALEMPPPAKHIMVFDKPFLLLLQRSKAKVPYFAMWVANAEILQCVKEN